MADLCLILRRSKDIFGDHKESALIYASTSRLDCEDWLRRRGLRQREGAPELYSKSGRHPYTTPTEDDYVLDEHKGVEIGTMSW